MRVDGRQFLRVQHPDVLHRGFHVALRTTAVRAVARLLQPSHDAAVPEQVSTPQAAQAMLARAGPLIHADWARLIRVYPRHVEVLTYCILCTFNFIWSSYEYTCMHPL